MGVADAFTQELDREAVTTRKLLSRVPSDQLSWKPHQKSMSLGELAGHLATMPGAIASWAINDSLDLATTGKQAPLASTDAICAAHDASMKQAKSVLSQLGDAGLMQE